MPSALRTLESQCGLDRSAYLALLVNKSGNYGDLDDISATKKAALAGLSYCSWEADRTFRTTVRAAPLSDS